MDESTPAHPAHRRTRRTLAAAALLLSVSTAVSACGGGSGSKASIAATVSPSSGASATAGGSADPAAPGQSASPAPGNGSTPGAGAPSAGSTPGGSAPLKPTTAPPAGGATPPDNPNDPQQRLKPTGYLTQGNQLTVFFFGGTCEKYGLKLNETKAGQVGVDVVVTQPARVGEMCPALVKSDSVVADLSQPLQGRSVVSLRDGSNVPLETAPNGGPVSAGN
ncbi:hypothetical protein C7C46_25515 [Streptomyces tateyamensis]|uniref:Serine/threonine protein kinase n=1 Tax=Streptomyces tateyamensis TaxID=565073 RepID=A0A2V4MWF8_9ACTN|nr:hypothetical protein [Streptomyces tateyamensis]PYC72949.1 hypothetical protein C7C46_25515 [Streptomyces tateyamensis]